MATSSSNKGNKSPPKFVAKAVRIGDNENILCEVLNGTLLVVESINGLYGLILRDPNDASYGLLIVSHTNEDELIGMANGLLNDVGDDLNFLLDSRIYERLQNDNNLVQYLFFHRIVCLLIGYAGDNLDN